MADHTQSGRGKRLRERRAAAGLIEVRSYVPINRADEMKEIAAEMRAEQKRDETD